MNKIDLIIECMDQILNDELPSPEKMMKAYRYACELKALKPVAWMYKGNFHDFDPSEWASPEFVVTPLYTAPPRKPWQGLTGTEINHIFAANVGYPERMCHAIKAKLKEKNNAV